MARKNTPDRNPQDIFIYPASPLGFSEAGRDFYNSVFIPMLQEIGFIPLDPWVLTDASLIYAVTSLPFGVKQKKAWAKLNPVIGANNRAAIEKCHMVVAILDGPDVDSDTAGEIGYAAGRGKPVIGYRGDFRLSADNIGSRVNLQIEDFIRFSGGEIVTSLEVLKPLLKKWYKNLQKNS